MKKIILLCTIVFGTIVNLKAQVTTFTVANAWETPLTLINNGSNGSWGKSLWIQNSHQNVSGIIYDTKLSSDANYPNSSYQRIFDVSYFGMNLNVGATIKSNEWALKLRNNTPNNGNGAAIGVNSSGSLIFTQTTNNFSTHTNPLTILSNGQVSINTSVNASCALAVTGVSRFNGTIRATKLEIVNSSVIWADYVFSKNYKLLSIPQLENFIKENKHLPNVPTAKEVAENGIDIAEMNKILLEKVEELTLYVIELSNKIQKLEEDK